MYKQYCFAAAMAALGALLSGAPASAAATLKYYGVTADLQVQTGITTAPDGAIWFTGTSTDGSTAGIGRLSTAGHLTGFPLPSGTKPRGIVTGPDGALWFGANGAIGRITAAGKVSAFRLASASQVNGITVGPDRALWFTQNDATVGRITTSGLVATHKVRFRDPAAIVTGPDGALWFTYNAHYFIGHLTTAGKYTQIDESPYFAGVGIARGFGDVWVTGDQPGVGSPQTVLARASTPAPFSMLDGYELCDAGGIAISRNRVWYAYVCNADWNIASATVDNHVTVYNRQDAMPGYTPAALTIGPGGTSVWFTLPGAWQRAGYIGELTPAG